MFNGRGSTYWIIQCFPEAALYHCYHAAWLLGGSSVVGTERCTLIRLSLTTSSSVDAYLAYMCRDISLVNQLLKHGKFIEGQPTCQNRRTYPSIYPGTRWSIAILINYSERVCGLQRGSPNIP